MIHFTKAISGACHQVTGAKENADLPCGTTQFCAHSTLYSATHNIQYIEYDCIRLRVKNAITQEFS